MRWQELTWPQLDALDRKLPVVVPLGSCEQHGYHLPLFVDTLQVEAIADRIEDELAEQVLVLPTLWLGSSHHHGDYPGTISVLPSVYSQMISALADSVLRAGFDRIFFLNGHGGNEVPAAAALTEMVATREDADAGSLAFASWWSIGRDALAPDKHDMATHRLSHACEYETSMILAIRPDLVRMDLAECPTLGQPANEWMDSEYGGKVTVFHRWHRFSDHGNMGDPRAASAEKGHSMLDAVVADIVAFLQDFTTWPALPVIKA